MVRRNEKVLYKGTPGEWAIVDGIAEITNGNEWLPYPNDATQLLETAREYGWFADDGLPAPGDRCRRNGNGHPFIRVELGRSPGVNARGGADSYGYHFHVVWHMPDPTEDDPGFWLPVKDQMFMRTSFDTQWWSVRSLSEIRNTITRNPVILPAYELP